MLEVCPDALLLHYANPMAINCWFTSGEGVRTVGLCHSVQHTADVPGRRSWARRTGGGRSGRPASTTRPGCWSSAHGRDVTAELREAVREYARGERDAARRGATSWYAGGREQVRTAIMDLTGYFQTESSHHASEYLPLLPARRRPSASYLAERWDYLEHHRGARRTSCSSWPTSSAPTAARVERGVRRADRRLGAHRHAARDLRQRAEHRPDHQPAGRLLRRGAVPGRPERRPADVRRRPAGRRAPASTSAPSPSRPASSRPTARAAASPSTPRSPSTS